MVKLTDIKLKDNIISSTIFPEDSKEPGYVSVDTVSGTIVESLLPVGYEYCKMHLEHASDALIEIVHSGVIPEKRTVMWY